MTTTREQLQAEFIELRNAQVKKGSDTRGRNLYFDHLNDTDRLAEIKTDEQLQAAIDKMKK